MSYADFLARVKSNIVSRDPKILAARKDADRAVLNMKALTPGAVHNDGTLSNISIQYQNEEFIGTKLMPVVTVDRLSNKYFIYSKRDRLAAPDDSVGIRSMPNEVSENRTTDNYSCQPYALIDFVDQATVDNADSPLNEMVDLVDSVNDAIAYREEKRIATKLTTAGNFPSQTTALSGSNQWDAGGSNPVKDIQNCTANLWTGKGKTKIVAYSSLEVYNVLARHPAILDLFKYGGSTPGLATAQMIANYFGIDEYLIGAGREDTANEGQTASYGRIWGKVFGVVRVATSPGPRTAAFGYTFRHGQKTTMQWFDPAPGVKGGYYAKVGLEEDHKIVASDTGFLITTAIS